MANDFRHNFYLIACTIFALWLFIAVDKYGHPYLRQSMDWSYAVLFYNVVERALIGALWSASYRMLSAERGMNPVVNIVFAVFGPGLAARIGAVGVFETFFPLPPGLS